MSWSYHANSVTVVSCKINEIFSLVVITVANIILVWSVEIAKICMAISPSAILYFLLELSRHHRIQYFSISITGVATRRGGR